jgi:hypothetical protein
MLAFRVPTGGQMLASMVSFAPQMFARQVAIFRGIYLEIEQSIGAWNREIDQIRAHVTREFPMNVSKQGIF